MRTRLRSTTGITSGTSDLGASANDDTGVGLGRQQEQNAQACLRRTGQAKVDLSHAAPTSGEPELVLPGSAGGQFSARIVTAVPGSFRLRSCGSRLLRYQAGEVTVLEVANAQTTLVLARNAYDDGLVDTGWRWPGCRL